MRRSRVGSEMCIRDRYEAAVVALNGEANKEALAQLDLIYGTITEEFKAKSVSYTHLTLPTIYSV